MLGNKHFIKLFVKILISVILNSTPSLSPELVLKKEVFMIIKDMFVIVHIVHIINQLKNNSNLVLIKRPYLKLLFYSFHQYQDIAVVWNQFMNSLFIE